MSSQGGDSIFRCLFSRQDSVEALAQYAEALQKAEQDPDSAQGPPSIDGTSNGGVIDWSGVKEIH
jgi:hypothetical protein